MAPARRALPLACLVLLLLWRAPGVCAQMDQPFMLQQPQDDVTLTAGETLILNCTLSGTSPAGPLKWLKGWGSGNETIYEDTGSFPRVTKAVNGFNSDYSIRIENVQPEDAGTYYCVKFRRTVKGVQLFAHGQGTAVSVHGVNPVSILVPCLVGILLEKGLLGALLIFLFKRARS